MPRWILAGVSALALLLLSRQTPLHSQALQRSMLVTVVDQAGSPVANLGPADFIVREDNVSREVLRVAPADEPLQVAILVDNSRAARDEVTNIRRALPGFVEVMTTPTPSGRRNEVAIVSLAERPTILANYTMDRAALDKAITLIWEQQPASGSYLLDGVLEVSQGFKKRGAIHPVILVLTTDGPDPGNRHYEQVLTALHDAGATLHVIQLGSPSSDIISDNVRDRDHVVEEGPRLTGGLGERLLTGSGLPTKLRQLAEVLTHQYLVTYGHPDTLIPPERVTVSARRADVTARGTLVNDPKARR